MSKVLVAILSVIITALVVGSGIYLFFNNRYLVDKNNLQTELNAANKKVSDLQIQLGAKCVASSADTSSSTTGTVTSDRADLMAVCQAQNPDMTCEVANIDGNYAKGTVGGSGGGAVWYAKKTNGTWAIVTAAQDDPSCSLTSGFPKSIVPTCSNF